MVIDTKYSETFITSPNEFTIVDLFVAFRTSRSGVVCTPVSRAANAAASATAATTVTVCNQGDKHNDDNVIVCMCTRYT